MTYFSSMPWADIVAVGIRTNADGPFAEDVFWQFLLRDGCFAVPGQCVDGAALNELYARLPGVDSAKLIRSMTSTRERIFRVWHHEESRFCPSREDLAVRFGALVERLGGNPEASRQVFDALYTAWSADTRRYHSLEHLVDCLRELDTAPASESTAELALWYHDVVYKPGRRDCEQQSALELLSDARRLAIPEEAANAATDLVRGTAHAHGRAATTAAADLVVDIDLSILGRDVLRFMDYEYGVEEEYSAVPVATFRRARGQFLAGLLQRDHIFQTEHFRRRYEQSAREQLAALLASPRYQSYR